MTISTIIGISVCVIFGTLFVGAIMARTVASSVDGDKFYMFMFFGSWAISTAFLILQLIDPLLGK